MACRHGMLASVEGSSGLIDFVAVVTAHVVSLAATASGADVKVVQTMLRHASAAMTLDQYGHLFGDRLDEVADAMATPRAAAVAHLLPKRTVADLGAKRRKVTAQ